MINKKNKKILRGRNNKTIAIRGLEASFLENDICGAVGGAFAAEKGVDFGVALEDFVSRRAKDIHQLLVEAVDIKVALDELADDGAVGDEVDQGDVLDAVADKEASNTSGDAVALVADDLGDLEESRLKGGGTRTYEGGIGGSQDVVCAVEDNLDVVSIVGDKLTVELLPYQAHAGNDETKLGMSRGNLKHDGQHAAELHLAATGKDGDC